MDVQPIPTIEKGVVTRVQDAYISPGPERTVITTGFGDLRKGRQKSYEIDSADGVTIEPESKPGAAPQTTQRASLPAVSDAIRASLQGVGTSLRIELDVGQLTDLVLRDIMMNKPNIFGGIA